MVQIKTLYLPYEAEVKGELYKASNFAKHLRDRLMSEGHIPEYLDIECKNMEFTLQHELDAKRRLLDP